MNYKLLKKLKKAGYSMERAIYSFDIKECLPAPTLSELIEACGDEFESIHKEENKNDNWAAVGFVKGKATQINGKTHKEAVAKLWLALNKK
jgi:hypothetical protein